MPLNNNDLVEAVKRKREREGLSIRALAAIVGISFSSLARIERGDGAPDNNSQIRLLEWLGEDGKDAGLSFEDVAFVHFRAAKNASSKTIQCLLKAAAFIKNEARNNEYYSEDAAEYSSTDPWEDSVSLSKEEMEEIAEEFREDLGLSDQDALDSLNIRVDGVDVYSLKMLATIPAECTSHLLGHGCNEWSAMSVPLDPENDLWAILLNDEHLAPRKRVTILEEYWHIMLGHKLTKIAKISDSFGRTYDSVEEHDAYYLASASLLPKNSVIDAIKSGKTAEDLAIQFGVSSQLAEYRIKRLGLWRLHRKLDVSLNEPSV